MFIVIAALAMSQAPNPYLPKYWRKAELNDAQLKAIWDIQEEYKPKLAALSKKAKQFKEDKEIKRAQQERDDLNILSLFAMEKVLTEQQLVKINGWHARDYMIAFGFQHMGLTTEECSKLYLVLKDYLPRIYELKLALNTLKESEKRVFEQSTLLANSPRRPGEPNRFSATLGQTQSQLTGEARERVQFRLNDLTKELQSRIKSTLSK